MSRIGTERVHNDVHGDGDDDDDYDGDQDDGRPPKDMCTNSMDVLLFKICLNNNNKMDWVSFK